MPGPLYFLGGRFSWMHRAIAALGCLLGGALLSGAQEPLRFFNARSSTPLASVSFELHAPTGVLVRVEHSTNLQAWSAYQTFRTAGPTNTLSDLLVTGPSQRFYRAVEATDAVLPGDHLATEDGDVVIHPVNHASLLLHWSQRTIYVDPVGGAARYQALPRADLILVTHDHGDHFDAATLSAVLQTNGVILAPARVQSALSTALKARSGVLTNGASTNLLQLTVHATPAYNANHERGRGNSYVLELGGRRLFISGDTGNIPEIRSLTDIDVAFVCMNVPFTMTINEAADLTRAFRPRVVYPYHYRNQVGTFADLNAFRQLVGPDTGVEVRQRKWY